jgi:hypothetical protein
MDIIADRHPYTPSVTRTPGASAQPRDETLDQGMAISIPGGVALSDTLDRGQVPHGVVLAVKPLADPPPPASRPANWILATISRSAATGLTSSTLTARNAPPALATRRVSPDRPDLPR